MNEGRTRALTVACGVVLGTISGTCCWFVLVHSEVSAPEMQYLPGAILGIFLFVAGQTASGWQRMPVARTCALLLATIMAWRLSLFVRLLGGPLPWIGASVVGALGVSVSVLVAWPQRDNRAQWLAAMAATGVGGGLLFTLASELRLYRGGKSWWPLLLLCLWQSALLIAAGLYLRESRQRSGG